MTWGYFYQHEGKRRFNGAQLAFDIIMVLAGYTLASYLA